MIDARELRIGNIVNRFGYATFVTEINEYYINDCLFTIKEYHPVYITEEWLIKFGFKKQEILKKVYEKDVYAKTGFLIHAIDDFFNLRGVSIKYVHQLQNLYYALTGQELCAIT
jgi:hypothetical protein